MEEEVVEEDEVEFLVRVSYFEIYNEDIRDLLSKNPNVKLEVKERPDVGVFVKDLSTYIVNNADDMDKIMTLGNRNRVVGSTAMNAESSRSHAIFSITVETIEMGPDEEEHIKMGRLHLVDLAQQPESESNMLPVEPLFERCDDIDMDISNLMRKSSMGSERQSKTGAVGQRLIEATKINLSLSTLGNVISALVDGKCTHIPYRNSKLTRILQDSLGGNSKTVMCATVGPADYNYDETISTLRYASRAKNVCNRARINEDPKDALLRQFQQEIETLKRQLDEGGGDHSEDGEGDSSEGDDDKKTKTSKIQSDNVQNGEGNEKTDDLNEDLLQHHQELALAINEHNVLQDKLESLEKKIIVGGENLLEKAEEQEKLLEMSVKELDQRRTEEEELRKQLQLKEAERIDIEEKYSSLQEEANALTKKLKKLQGVLKSVQEEQKDVVQENQREMEGLLENVRQLHKELSLQEALHNMYIPEKHMDIIKKHAHWNEDIGEWQLRCVAYTGNNMRKTVAPSSPLVNPEITQPNLSHVYLTYSSGRPQTSGKNRVKYSTSRNTPMHL